MTDLQSTISFNVRICTHCSWSYFIAKCSRNRLRLVLVSSPIQPTWFLPFLYRIFIQIEFLGKFMGFQKIFLFQNNEKNITNKDQAPDFMYLSYFKSSYFPLNSAYIWTFSCKCHLKRYHNSRSLIHYRDWLAYSVCIQYNRTTVDSGIIDRSGRR